MKRFLLPALLLFSSAPALNGASLPSQDARNIALVDGNTHFTMPAFATREEWQARAKDIRKQILASAGLLPMPAKTPLHPQIFGKLLRDGYSVEKVLIETYPGFYLGGNLYRPLGKTGPFPAVLSPHGHWDYGRLENTAIVSVPGRAINLARQGFVVFTYDMVGYNDTTQIPHGDRGPHLGTPPQELWNISTMGLQLWNSIRSVDFLSSLPDVDKERIATTGASGGGTQIFLLTAVEDRIQVAAPVNMISFIHQGGGCQAAANLRVDLNNVVIGAMIAPRPLLMVSASGDWTRNTPAEEFPAIRGIYKLFDAEPKIEQVQIDAPHNYNQLSREAVYTFLGGQFFQRTSRVSEERFRMEQIQDVLALHGRTLPANAVTMEGFAADRVREAKSDTARLQPKDAASLAQARQGFFERLRYSLLATLPSASDVVAENSGAISGGEKLIIGRASVGDRIPAMWLSPTAPKANLIPTLVIHPDGMGAVQSMALTQSIVEKGGIVLAIDAFQTGSAKAPRDTSKPGFHVFHRSNDANRIQDILTAISYLKERSKSAKVNLVGLGAAGVWTYFARALAGPGVNLSADIHGFRTDSDSYYLENFYVPGLRRAGDFHAASVLNTQGGLQLYNVPESFPTAWVRQSAAIGGQAAEVNRSELTGAGVVAWLMSQSGR